MPQLHRSASLVDKETNMPDKTVFKTKTALEYLASIFLPFVAEKKHKQC